MKKYILILGLLIACSVVFGQNRISNPGFESGTTGWNSIWSRDGLGKAILTDTLVHSGMKAMHIVYTGTLDWAYQVSNYSSVKTGDLFELSGWVYAGNITSDAQLSVELIDSLGNVMSWVFGSCEFQETNMEFKYFSSKFVIPDKVRRVITRVVGSNPCDIFIDDISLNFISNLVSSNNSRVLENDSLRVELFYPSFKMNVLNKKNGISFNTNPVYEYQFISVDTSEVSKISVLAHNLISDQDYQFDFGLKNNAIDIKISADSASVPNTDLHFPGPITSRSNDYLVVPRGTGVLWPVNKAYPFGNFSMFEWKSTMAFIGVTDLTSGYMLVSDDPWDTEAGITVEGSKSLLSPTLVHHTTKGNWGYNRTLYMVFVTEGYNEMCNWYKDYVERKGYHKTFSEKASTNPEVSRLKGAADFWVINMNITVSDVTNFAHYGIDRAIFSLSTYESFLPALIDSINHHGFLSSKYDIFTDVWPANQYPSAGGYRRDGYPDDVIVKNDGNYQEGWLAYYNSKPFQGYVLCSATHSEYAKKGLPLDLSTNHYNCRFVDVELASGLKECYSAVHPVSRKTDAQARIDLLNTVKNDFSLVTGVEEARDFAFPVADYGEGTMTLFPQVNAGYDWSNPIDTIGTYYGKYNMNPAIRVPLHGLVYHNVHIPTWYTGDGVSKVPSFWDDKDLFNILYASMPLFMPPSRVYWNTNKEKYLTSYHLISSITRNTAFEEMTSHRFLSDDRKIQQTEFSNGWKITVNFDTMAHQSGSVLLAKKGFYASDGQGQEVFRIKDPASGFTLAAGSIEDRLFINPQGIEQTYRGVKTNGTVLLLNDSSGIQLAFIGNSNSISLNPDQLPWKLGNAFSVVTGKKIPMQSTGDGWYKIYKPVGENFVRFDKNNIALTMVNPTMPSCMELIANPNMDEVTIKLFLQTSRKVKLTIYNILGEPVKKLLDDDLVKGYTNLSVDTTTMLPNFYLISFTDGEQVITRKFIVQ
jgi:hypothetical protein